MPDTPCIPGVNRPNSNGYCPQTRQGVRKYEHQWAWEDVHGPVPDGLVLDHLCHDPDECQLGSACPHRSCRNVQHLKPVTRGDNVRRGYRHELAKTHCPQNHPYDAENTYANPRGGRHCRICTRAAIAKHKAAKRVPREPQTHCKRDHEFTDKNTYYRPDNGHRQCRACKREAKARFDAKE